VTRRRDPEERPVHRGTARAEEDRLDPELREVLRAVGPEPPTDSVDWRALHARILTRAEPLLARRRRGWWRVAARWARAGAPAAAAASLALAAWLGTGNEPGSSGSAPVPVPRAEVDRTPRVAPEGATIGSPVAPPGFDAEEEEVGVLALASGADPGELLLRAFLASDLTDPDGEGSAGDVGR